MSVPDDAPATTPSTEEKKIALDGKEFTEAELREAIRGGFRQADYTRKTQSLAEEKREFEEWKAQQEAEIEARLASLEAGPASPSADDDPWSQRFNKLESLVTEVHQTLAQRQAAEAEEAQVQSQMQAIEAALGEYSIKPGFNRQEILQTMHAYGMDRPEQVDAAYQIVAGPKIARAMAEREAVARGATAPGVMGSDGMALPAAPFASANEAAPTIDASKMSWQDLRAAAMADPNRPRG